MKNHGLWRFAAHSSVVLSMVFLVLFVIDRVNPAMDFLGSDQSDWLLLCFCCCAFLDGIISAVFLFRKSKAQYQQKREGGHA